MRVLVISAFYPPYAIGGCEHKAQEIDKQLRARGHAVHVLTSTYGVHAPGQEPGIHRLLSLESNLYHYRPSSVITYSRRLRRNLQVTRDIIQAVRPEVVLVHVMWNLTWGIPWTAEQMCPGRVVYYVADHWPYVPDVHVRYWQLPANRSLPRRLKQWLAPLALAWIQRQNRRFQLRFDHVLCVSRAIRDALLEHTEIPPERMQVVYNGIDTKRFRPQSPETTESRTGLALLYAGSLVPHKGVHTAIQAMEELHRTGSLEGVQLTVAGSGHPDYEARLRDHVARAGLDEHVRFIGHVARDQMPELLPRFDVLLFPSIWEEPLARIVQEAMACGLVVVGTPTGGTPEILEDGETGLVFPPEDPRALADRIRYLKENPQAMAKIRQNARVRVVEQFDMVRMVDEIEAYLSAVARGEPALPETRPRMAGERVPG